MGPDPGSPLAVLLLLVGAAFCHWMRFLAAAARNGPGAISAMLTDRLGQASAGIPDR